MLRTRPRVTTAPAPAPEKIRDQALDLATQNRLVAKSSGRDWSNFNRDDMVVSADEIAAWLAQAPDFADYGRRRAALRAVLSMGGVQYETDYHRTTYHRGQASEFRYTCGAPLVQAASEFYAFIIDGTRPEPTKREPATA